jgi:hypothetical protein
MSLISKAATVLANHTVSEETAKLLIDRGEAVDLNSRLAAFTGQAIMQVES